MYKTKNKENKMRTKYRKVFKCINVLTKYAIYVKLMYVRLTKLNIIIVTFFQKLKLLRSG